MSSKRNSPRGALLADSLAMPDESEPPITHSANTCPPFRAHRPRLGRISASAAALFLAFLGGSKPAGATLGGDGASVVANEHNLSADARVEKTSSGEHHDLTLPSGIVIRELVSARGVVYAVAWRGPRMPNLRELLGPYFAQLLNHSSRGSRNHLILTGDDFEIRAQGHQHAFAGLAWVPSEVPSGVDLDRVWE
jgi:hypothetical protein